MWLIILVIIIVVICCNKKKQQQEAEATSPPSTPPQKNPTPAPSTSKPAPQTSNSDADSLMTLADRYLADKDNESSTDLGLEYLERAADAGHPKAIAIMAETAYKLANVRFGLLNTLGIADISITLTEAHKWSHKLAMLPQNTSDEQLRQSTWTRYLDTIVWLSYLMEKDYNGILRITQGVSSPLAQAYYGRALYEFAETRAELDHAFDLLKNFMHPNLWVDKYNSNELVRIARCGPCVLLASLYRLEYKDIYSAYTVFDFLLQQASDPEEREALLDDLSRFRQTPSGHYEYVE